MNSSSENDLFDKDDKTIDMRDQNEIDNDLLSVDNIESDIAMNNNNNNNNKYNIKMDMNKNTSDVYLSAAIDNEFKEYDNNKNENKHISRSQSMPQNVSKQSEKTINRSQTIYNTQNYSSPRQNFQSQDDHTKKSFKWNVPVSSINCSTTREWLRNKQYGCESSAHMLVTCGMNALPALSLQIHNDLQTLILYKCEQQFDSHNTINNINKSSASSSSIDNNNNNNNLINNNNEINFRVRFEALTKIIDVRLLQIIMSRKLKSYTTVNDTTNTLIAITKLGVLTNDEITIFSKALTNKDDPYHLFSTVACLHITHCLDHNPRRIILATIMFFYTVQCIKVTNLWSEIPNVSKYIGNNKNEIIHYTLSKNTKLFEVLLRQPKFEITLRFEGDKQYAANATNVPIKKTNHHSSSSSSSFHQHEQMNNAGTQFHVLDLDASDDELKKVIQNRTSHTSCIIT